MTITFANYHYRSPLSLAIEMLIKFLYYILNNIFLFEFESFRVTEATLLNNNM